MVLLYNNEDTAESGTIPITIFCLPTSWLSNIGNKNLLPLKNSQERDLEIQGNGFRQQKDTIIIVRNILV